VSGKSFQPPHWALNERLRRHKEGSAADVKCFEDAADETHVVMEGQPEHGDRVVVSASPRATDGIQVVQQIAVRDHHAFRRARRTRGVLHEGGCVRVDFWYDPLLSGGWEYGIRGAPPQGTPAGQVVHRSLELRLQLGGGEDEAGLRIRDNRCDAADYPVAHRRVDRYRDGSGVDTPEEAGDKVQARGAEDQYPFAPSALSLQCGRDCSGLDVQLVISKPAMFFPTGRIAAIVERNLVSIAFGSLPQKV
jgi:hypothetical protein